MGVGAGVAVSVGRGVGVGSGVAVAVGSGVNVGVAVAVGVGSGVNVGSIAIVGVGSGVNVGAALSPEQAAAVQTVTATAASAAIVAAIFLFIDSLRIIYSNHLWDCAATDEAPQTSTPAFVSSSASVVLMLRTRSRIWVVCWPVRGAGRRTWPGVSVRRTVMPGCWSLPGQGWSISTT